MMRKCFLMKGLLLLALLQICVTAGAAGLRTAQAAGQGSPPTRFRNTTPSRQRGRKPIRKIASSFSMILSPSSRAPR